MIRDRLRTYGINVLQLTDENKDVFRQPGCVTLSGIRRAKGNEAYKVYAVNLHLDRSKGTGAVDTELVRRNQAFVALTRSKLWCVAVGREGPLMTELVAAKRQSGVLRFPAFNQTSLRRSMADSEAVQMALL
jgi:superfamily I DNA and RNA helicase